MGANPNLGVMVKRTAYLCGPTVYDVPHLGNLKTLYKSIEDFYNSRTRGSMLLMNLTDIGDKVYETLTKKEILERVNFYSRQTIHLLKELGLKPWVLDLHRTSQRVKQVRKLLKNLLVLDTWSFKLDRFGLRGIPKKLMGSQFHWRQFEEESPHSDFSLWRAETYPFYNFWINGTNYKGIPGWHSECAALIANYMALNFTHYGGMDLKPIHHYNEELLLQSLKNYSIRWVHCEPLVVSSDLKMSKSTKSQVYVPFYKVKRYKESFEKSSLKRKSHLETFQTITYKTKVTLKPWIRKLNLVKKLFYSRLTLKKLKLYSHADNLRLSLKNLGYELEDSPKGPVLWKWN